MKVPNLPPFPDAGFQNAKSEIMSSKQSLNNSLGNPPLIKRQSTTKMTQQDNLPLNSRYQVPLKTRRVDAIHATRLSQMTLPPHPGLLQDHLAGLTTTQNYKDP